MAAAGTSLYPPEHVEQGLLALALNGGNGRLASEQLATLGIDIPSRTLYDWRHTERYAELHEQHKHQIEQAAIRQFREIVVVGAEAQLAATQRARDGIDELDAKDASAAAKNLAIASGVAADKLLVFTDRPNVIHSRPEPEQTLSGLLRALGIPPTQTVDSTAEEVLPEAPPEALIAETRASNPRETAPPASSQSA